MEKELESKLADIKQLQGYTLIFAIAAFVIGMGIIIKIDTK